MAAGAADRRDPPAPVIAFPELGAGGKVTGWSFDKNIILCVRDAENVRVFKNAWFSRFARKEAIDDVALCRAVRAAGQGLIDADLGGGLIKQRIARPGGGKSGGYRTLILFKAGTRAVFAYGFAKNMAANVSTAEVRQLKDAAAVILALSEQQMTTAVEAGKFVEVICDETDETYQGRKADGLSQRDRRRRP